MFPIPRYVPNPYSSTIPINLTLFLRMFQRIFFSYCLCVFFFHFSMLMCLLYFVLNSTIFNLIAQILYSKKNLYSFGQHIYRWRLFVLFVLFVALRSPKSCLSLIVLLVPIQSSWRVGVHGGDLLVFRPIGARIIEYWSILSKKFNEI
jgi:hypothetical protein